MSSKNKDTHGKEKRGQPGFGKPAKDVPPDKVFLSVGERNWADFDAWFKQYARKTHSSSGAGNILISMAEVDFYDQVPNVEEDEDESNITLTTEQLKEVNNLTSEEEKEAEKERLLSEEAERRREANARRKRMRKAQDKFIESIPKLQLEYNLGKSAICGELYLHFKRDTQRLMSTDEDYQKAVADGDLLKAYKLLRAAHIVPDGELEDQQLEAEEALRDLRQRDRSLASHLAYFEERLRKCEFLKCAPSDSRLMNYFLDSLNPHIFGDLRLDIKTKRVARPKSYQELKTIVKQFDVEYRKLEKKKKFDHVTRGQKAEAAYVTTSTAGQSQEAAKKSQGKKDLSSIECYNCHAKGHMARDCPKAKQKDKSKPKSAKENHVHFSSAESSDEEDGVSFQITIGDDDKGGGVSFMSIRDKFVLGLDTMSTVNVVNDIKLLKNVERCSKRIAGVNGNAPVFSTACGEFLDFGKAYYVKESPVNCVSFDKLRGLFQRRFVEKDESWHIDNGRSHYVFKRSDEGLPATRVSFEESHSYAIADEVELSKAELERVKRVKEIYYGLNCRGRHSLKVLFDSGNLLRCDLTGKDVDNWLKLERIEGHEPHAIRGKMKFRKSKISSGPPATRCGQKLSVDLFFVNKRPYFLAVDAFTDTLLVVAMRNKSSKELEAAIESVHAAFEERGHKVELITCDSESNLGAAKDFASRLGIAMEAKPPGQHEELAERHIGIIAEGFRSTLSKFKDDHGCNLPRQLYPYLIRYVVSSANMVPNEKCSPASPLIKFAGRKPDLKSDLAFRFGELVLAGVPNHRAT